MLLGKDEIMDKESSSVKITPGSSLDRDGVLVGFIDFSADINILGYVRSSK